MDAERAAAAVQKILRGLLIAVGHGAAFLRYLQKFLKPRAALPKSVTLRVSRRHSKARPRPAPLGLPWGSTALEQAIR